MKLLITIVDRKICSKVLKIFEENEVHFNTVCLGKGSANSEMLHYFGLGETEKNVIFSMIRKEDSEAILENLYEGIEFSRHGTGVAFTVPLSSIGKKLLTFLQGENEEKMLLTEKNTETLKIERKEDENE